MRPATFGINHHLATCLLGLAGVSAAAHAGDCAFNITEEVTFTGTLPDAGLLVNSTLGDVTITADPSATTLKAVAKKHAGADTEEKARQILARMTPRIEPSKGSDSPFTLDSGFEKQSSFSVHNGNVSMSVDWVITVPTNARINIDCSLGDVEVKGTAAGVTIDASLGDVTVEASGKLEIEASLGDVNVRVLGSPAPLEVRSSMGDVEITTPASGWGKIHAATTQGEVSSSNWSGTARKWVSNDSSLHAEFDGGGPAMSVSSSMGDVSIKFVD
jgi:hypothetical protein